MEQRVTCRYIRIAPRKLRLVADMIRGKKAAEAKAILRFLPKRGARVILKAIDAAIAGLGERAPKMDLDETLVRTIYVNEGPTLKRFLPRAHGRATPIRKGTSHLTIVLAAQGVPE